MAKWSTELHKLSCFSCIGAILLCFWVFLWIFDWFWLSVNFRLSLEDFRLFLEDFRLFFRRFSPFFEGFSPSFVFSQWLLYVLSNFVYFYIIFYIKLMHFFHSNAYCLRGKFFRYTNFPLSMSCKHRCKMKM